ncbi:MAG: hypothetical protein Q8Q09_21275 [Deltaproteobacteria bacterium]|nr:hypothetical protein [Deltaproteobacteria bacterium]
MAKSDPAVRPRLSALALPSVIRGIGVLGVLSVLSVLGGASGCRGRGPLRVLSRPATVRPVHAIIPANSQTEPALPAEPAAPDPLPPPRGGEPLRWVLAGGGATPSLAQISLAQDLAQAQQRMQGEGLVLFGSGPGSRVLALRGEPTSPPSLSDRLSELLDPRGGRDSRFVWAPVRSHGPFTREALEGALLRALARSSEPLLVYLAAHGSGGETPRESVVGTWGDQELSVQDLTGILDGARSPRPVRVVSTSCFGGGFAELIYREADPSKGLAVPLRCGLFATTWDREASGCDPDPDRRAQEGFGLHFLNALAQRAPDGSAVALSDVDYDGDGHIGLLDAHTRARITGRSIDVPTTTSERYVRQQLDGLRGGVDSPSNIPDEVREEEAVIAALSAALTIPRAHGELRTLITQTEALRRTLQETVEASEARLTALDAALVTELRARYPVLEDRWHRDWDAVVRANTAEITALLDTHPSRAVRTMVAQESERDVTQLEALELRYTLMLRLERAWQTRRLAAHLRARGGAPWRAFVALRTCERAGP